MEADFETVPVSLRLPEPLYFYIKSLARKQSHLQDRDIKWSDLAREALAEQFPIEVEKPVDA